MIVGFLLTMVPFCVGLKYAGRRSRAEIAADEEWLAGLTDDEVYDEWEIKREEGMRAYYASKSVFISLVTIWIVFLDFGLPLVMKVCGFDARKLFEREQIQ